MTEIQFSHDPAYQERDVGFPYRFLLDTREYRNLQLYYAVKNKYGYQLSNPGVFLQALQEFLHGDYEVIVYPQSSHGFISWVAEQFGVPTVCLEKTPLEDIRLAVGGMALQRSERKSIEACLTSMNEFQINGIKANQRHRFNDLLFRPINVAGRVLIVDDSLFTSTTMTAMFSAIGRQTDAMVVFSK